MNKQASNLAPIQSDKAEENACPVVQRQWSKPRIRIERLNITELSGNRGADGIKGTS